MSDSLDANKFGDIRSALQEGDVQWPYVAAMLNSMSEGRHKIAAATAIVERAMVLGQFDSWVQAQYLNKGVHCIDFQTAFMGHDTIKTTCGQFVVDDYELRSMLSGQVEEKYTLIKVGE